MKKRYYDSDIEIIARLIQSIFHISIEIPLKDQRTYEYLEKYMYIVGSDYRPYRSSVHCKGITRNTVWICWLQGIETAPRLIKRCVESVYKNIKDCNIILLSEENYRKYIRLPKEIEEKKKAGIISKTFFSDILRLFLLAEYGGTWVDATVFCTGKVPDYMLKSDFFCFQSSIHFKYISLIKGSSWWLSANPNNDLICKARNIIYEYCKYEDRLINYFLLHLIFSKLVDVDSRCRSIWYTMPYVENSNSHALMGRMRQPYNDELFEIICNNSVVHKLSYKIGTGGRGTFYSELISKREK